MATKYWSTIKMNGTVYTATVDATYRVWVNDLHAALLEVGLVVDSVSAASHMNLTTATCPLHDVRTNFIVYELNDALSATLPIYIKIAYGGLRTGNTQTAAAFPNCWVQIGTTVNAAGVLGGLVTNEFSPAFSTNSNSGLAQYNGPNILSKSQGFLFFAASSNLVATRHPIGCISFAVERVPDSSGNLTADGYTVVTPPAFEIVAGTPAAGNALARTITATVDTGWQPNACVCNGGAAAVSVNGTIQFQNFYHAVNDLRPFRGMMAYHGSALVQGVLLNLPAAGGGSRTYRALGGAAINEYYFRPDSLDATFGVACLWE